MQEKAGEAELRQVIAFLSDSVAYDHPRAGAHIVGKQAITDGMRGFLGATRNPRIAVRHLVASARVVVLEEEVTFEVRDTSGWLPRSRAQITVFEIDNGHITHVVELWQPR